MTHEPDRTGTSKPMRAVLGLLVGVVVAVGLWLVLRATGLDDTASLGALVVCVAAYFVVLSVRSRRR